MRELRLVLSLAALGLVIMLAVAPAAEAQATRTWVSGVGDDANPCSRTAPCKTFPGAISKTAAGGEISALDPGGFGAVTITKSITINGDGTLAGILASLTNGIIVSAAATDKVIIRNISINGAGNGLNGIRFLAGNQLTVENVTIAGFTGNCISVELATTGRLLVHDTNLTKCATGVRVNTTAGQAVAVLDNVRAQNMGSHGVEAANLSFVTINRSMISNNNIDAVRAGLGSTIVNIQDSVLAFNNGAAVNASANLTRIRISDNAIINNNSGISIAAGGIVESTGRNRVAGNNASTAPNAIYNED
jgi:hypothetical protein